MLSLRKRITHVPPVEARAAALAVVTSVVLMLVKFAAYALTGSAAVFSDAMESIVNVIAAAIASYALILAHRPADAEHPYGHGKIEFVSAGFEGGMILLAAVVIAAKTLDTVFFHTIRVDALNSGVLLVGATMIVNWVVGKTLVRTGRKHQSITLEADGKHLLTDAITTAVALVALVLIKLTHAVWIDPVAALLMSAYMGVTAVRLMRRSAAGLMDEQDLVDEKLIKSILDSHLGPDGKPPLICSYHKLRHRHSGRYHWVDFHIMVPPTMDVRHAHDIASAIEYEIEQAIGEGNATAHIEPCADEGCAHCQGHQ